MKLKKFTALAVLLISVTGCRGETDIPVRKQRDVFAMDTYMSLTAYGDKAENALDTATERIAELESLFSVNSENSDIWRINNADGSTIEISCDTADIIEKAIGYCNRTGTLDITIYPVLKEWGFTTQEYRIPDSNTLSELLANVNYNNIRLDGNSITIPENYMIDLGAVAKGYTSDEVIFLLKENGVKSAIVSLGGNVQALGHKPDGSDWNVAVSNPFSPADTMCIVSVGEKAVITSGNYERFFTGEDGRNYWHIIDKTDGFPADNGLVSVTVIGDSGIMCDALSTALFISGTEQAQEYWYDNGGFDMILVTDDGRIIYTDGIKDCFKNTSNMPSEVISRD